MKKRVCAVCAALVVVCCSVAPVFAVSESWFNVWREKEFTEALKQPYWIARNWGDENQYSYVYTADEITKIRSRLSIDGTSVHLTLGSNGFYVPLSGLSSRELAWNFSIPVAAGYTNDKIVGYLYPNPNGIDGNFFFPEPYLPDYTEPPWVGTETVCRIITPRDGFKQQGVKLVTTRVYFCIPFDGNYKSIKYAVKGFNADLSKAKSVDYNIIEDGKKVEGILTVEGIVKAWNTEHMIYAEVTDYTGKAWRSEKCRVTCYEDFVDEDGDGLDDRTGQDEWTGGSGDPADPRPGVGDDLSGFDNIGDMLSRLSGSLSGLFGFFQQFFSFLPSSLFVLMGVGIAIVILLRVFGR